MHARISFFFVDIVRHDQSEENEEIQTTRREENAKKEEKRKGKEPLDCLAVVIPAF